MGPTVTQSMNLACGRMEPCGNLLEVDKNPCLPPKKSGRTWIFWLIDCGLWMLHLPSGYGLLWSWLTRVPSEKGCRE